MDAKEIIARRVAQEVKPNTLVNLGEIGNRCGNRGNRGEIGEIGNREIGNREIGDTCIFPL